MHEYINDKWVRSMLASSADVVRCNIVCSCLQSGVLHPNEATFKEMVGLHQWLCCDPARPPTAAETHHELRRQKLLLQQERNRMPAPAVPYYLAMPGPTEFHTAHAAAYDLAWGPDSWPATGPTDLPHGRTRALLTYLVRGVPLRRTSNMLRPVDARLAGDLGGQGPGQGPGQQLDALEALGQLVDLLTPVLQGAPAARRGNLRLRELPALGETASGRAPEEASGAAAPAMPAPGAVAPLAPAPGGVALAPEGAPAPGGETLAPAAAPALGVVAPALGAAATAAAAPLAPPETESAATGLDAMLNNMAGAKRGRAIEAELQGMKRPKMPKHNKPIQYGQGTIQARPEVNKWRIFMAAPYKVDLTRQWGPKATREAQFQAACELVETKMAEASRA